MLGKVLGKFWRRRSGPGSCLSDAGHPRGVLHYRGGGRRTRNPAVAGTGPGLVNHSRRRDRSRRGVNPEVRRGAQRSPVGAIHDSGGRSRRLGRGCPLFRGRTEVQVGVRLHFVARVGRGRRTDAGTASWIMSSGLSIMSRNLTGVWVPRGRGSDLASPTWHTQVQSLAFVGRRRCPRVGRDGAGRSHGGLLLRREGVVHADPQGRIGRVLQQLVDRRGLLDGRPL